MHTFRFATEEDVGLILKFIRDLAEYEKMSDQVVATEALLREWIFEKHRAEVLFICEGQMAVGFALFFHNFSTFLGRAGIYLEDLFVMPEYRNRHCSKSWHRSRLNADAAGLNGHALTGTGRASIFIFPLVRFR